MKRQDLGSASGVPKIADDLLRRPTRQPRASEFSHGLGHELPSRLHWYDRDLNLRLGSSARRGHHHHR